MFKEKIIIFLLTLLITPIYANKLSKTTGFLTFNEKDFPVDILNYPISINETWQATFDETRTNRIFMHTFQYNISKGCIVSAANLTIKIKNLSTINNNDTIGFVDNGKILFKTNLWKKNETFQTIKTLTFDLAKLPKKLSLLETLNDGDFSFFIEDDTSVDSVELVWTQFCGVNMQN